MFIKKQARVNMNNNDKTKIRLTQVLIVLLVSIFFVLVSLLVNVLMCNLNIDTAEGLETSHWLGFWGGYIGSAFGVIATLFAFLFTYIQNEKQHRATQKEMHKQKQLQVLPVIDFSLNYHIHFINFDHLPVSDFTNNKYKVRIDGANLYADYLKNNNMGILVLVTIKNIGAGPMLKCSMELLNEQISFNNFAISQEKCYGVLLPKSFLNSDLDVIFYFQNVMKNTYQQTFQAHIEKNNIKMTLISSPELID